MFNNKMDYFPPLEQIECDEEQRLAHQPIGCRQMFDFYKILEAAFWTDEDIDKDAEKDRFHYEKATPEERRLFDYVQGFFAVSDFVVADTIGDKLMSRIKQTDVRIVYQFITMVENIHMITYSKIIEKSIVNSKDREKVLTSASRIPSIKRKTEWIKKWVGSENDVQNLNRETILGFKEIVAQNNRILQALHPDEDIQQYKTKQILEIEKKLAEPYPSLDRIMVALGIIENIYFSGSFAAVFWFAKNGLFPGASKANELIKVDEGKHVDNGAIIHNTLIEYKEKQSVVHEMVREAVEIESEFMQDAMPTGLRGMNSKLMIKYIKFMADNTLQKFGYETLYNIGRDEIFDFMMKQSITDENSDFFKGNSGNYKKHGKNETAEDKTVVLDIDLSDEL